MSLLSVEHLTTRFHKQQGVINAVDDVSFYVEAGETLAIVGESGSGKSVTCYSLLQLIDASAGQVKSGVVNFNGVDLLQCDKEHIQQVRGNEIAIIFQDPMTSLNPYLTVGEQLIEPLLHHKKMSRKQARLQAVAALEEVGITQARQRYHSYPHEFSGGMRQRVMIAMALITKPKLLIADEPTTALDVTIQAQILDLIKQLQHERQIAIIFISHDLGVVAGIADRVMVMYQGKVVEHGSVEEVYYQTKHHYTQRLLDSVPSGSKQFVGQATQKPLLCVRQLKTYFRDNSRSLVDVIFNKKPGVIKAVDGVDLTVNRGEIVGLVGESGSGKSTLGRSILQLVPITQGSIEFDGCELTQLSSSALKKQRRKIQMIFQDPYASLNPRMTVFDTLAEPLLYHGLANKKTVYSKVRGLMDDVGLLAVHLRKYPHEFSGGQRQRIAIGRAIALEPELIVADEPVSALDVTIQAQILELMLGLVKKYSLSMLFISHDLSVVRVLCDRLLVLNKGRIVEHGDTETVFTHPVNSYTQSLLSAIPIADPDKERSRVSGRTRSHVQR